MLYLVIRLFLSLPSSLREVLGRRLALEIRTQCVFLTDFNQNLNIPTNFIEMPRDSVLPIYNQAKKQCCVVANSNLHSGGASFDCRPGARHINS